MNKKVLVLSSSPRRGGNSDLLCDQFINGTRETGHLPEKIFMKDKKINYCTGCGQMKTKNIKAYNRMLKRDVHYCSVIDMASLKKLFRNE